MFNSPISTKTVVLILLGVTLAFSAPMFFNPDGIASEDEFRNLDWISLRIFDAYLYKSVYEFGQMPLWCPYLGGGYPVYQHPSDASYSPFAIPVLLFGEIYGIKINMIILLFLGALGAYLICRDIFRMETAGSLFSSLAFLVAGWFPSQMLVGFYNQAMYYLIPLIVYFVIRAFREMRFVIPAGIIYALFAYQGLWGIFSLGIFLGFVTAVYCFVDAEGNKRFSLKPMIALVLTVVLTVAIAGPRLYEIRDLNSQGEYPHAEEQINDCSDDPPPETWERFYQSPGHFLYSALWHVPIEGEYDATGYPTSPEYPFLGIPWLAFLFFFGGVVVLRGKFVPWLATLLIITVMTFGQNSPVNLYKVVICPFEVLQRMKDCFKYFNFFIMLVIVIGSGGFLDYLCQKAGNGALLKVLIILAFVTLVPFAAIHGNMFYELLKVDSPKIERSDQFHQLRWKLNPTKVHLGLDYRELIRPQKFISYYNIRNNIGTIDWYADIYLPEHTNAKFYGDDNGVPVPNPDYKGEAYFATMFPNRVKGIEIKSNSIAVDVEVKKPGLLIINQNYHKSWIVNKGKVQNHHGLLAAELPEPGRYNVKFSFTPTLFYLGRFWMVFSLIICATGWWVLKRKSSSTDPEGAGHGA